jgi:transcriptional regulator with XRE-family HTH domain
MAHKSTALYAYRKAAGLSLHELAFRSNVHYTTLQRAETYGCEQMIASKAIRIITALGIDDLGALFTRDQKAIEQICTLLRERNTCGS